jgi:hypothetical protein
MNDAIQTLLANAVRAGQFPPNSRYQSTPTARLRRPDGTEVLYLRRRFVPGADRFSTLLEHRVVEGDRLDNLAAQYLGDPELFWRLGDANNAMRPDDLLAEVGRRLRITLPEGIPAPANV